MAFATLFIRIVTARLISSFPTVLGNTNPFYKHHLNAFYLHLGNNEYFPYRQTRGHMYYFLYFTSVLTVPKNIRVSLLFQALKKTLIHSVALTSDPYQLHCMQLY